MRILMLMLMAITVGILPAQARHRHIGLVEAIVTYHPIRSNLSSRHSGHLTAFGSIATSRMAATNAFSRFHRGRKVEVVAYKNGGRWVYIRPVSRIIDDKMGSRHRREALRGKLRLDLYVPRNHIPKAIRRLSGKRCLVRVG